MSFSVGPTREESAPRAPGRRFIARRRWNRFALQARLWGLLCLAGCAGSQSVSSHPIQRDWVLVTTDHFRVYSDLDADDVKSLAAGLERDLVLIGQAAFQSPAVVIEPTDVVVFSRRDHFHRYFPKSTGGVSYPRLPLLPESHHTVATFEQLDANLQITLRHELVHDVYARNFGAAPPWLTEGVAQYFSTVELVDDQIHIGVPLPDRAMTTQPYPFAAVVRGTVVQAIPRKTIPAASALLGMSADDFYGHDQPASDEVGTSPEAMAHYFGAWALVHYLMGPNGDYSLRFQTFLTVVTTTSVSAAWESAFAGVDLHQLDVDFRSFLSAGRFALSGVPYRAPARGPSFTVGALSDGEVHVLLAKLALRPASSTSQTRVFSEELEAAIHASSPPPDAYYLRGMYAHSVGNDAEAERDLATALRLAPDDPHILRASLSLWLERRHGHLSGQELLRFREGIETLEAHASSPSDLLFAASFYAAAGEVPRALTLGARAVAGSPVDPLVLSMYAHVLEACDRPEEAIATQRRAIEFLNEDRDARRHFQQDLERLESQRSQTNQRTPTPPSELTGTP